MTERFTHERVFPMNLKKQLACIYTNNFFSGLRITDAVWVALLAARGIPYHRVHDVAGCAQALRLVEAMTPLA